MGATCEEEAVSRLLQAESYDEYDSSKNLEFYFSDLDGDRKIVITEVEKVTDAADREVLERYLMSY